ncbi:MAG: mechanosensitive ion channel family protein [Nitrospiraceae bacterium]|nr:MAG: mechanosensitive ion channel family protein [Nitrospiraceae bacterium]
MENIFIWMQSTLGVSGETGGKLLSSLAAIILTGLLRWIIIFIVYQKTEDSHTRYRWRKGSLYTLSVILVFIVGRIWYEGFRDVSTYLGLLSAGVAIALRDVLTNFAGWIFIFVRQPFQVGDRIKIGHHTGDVIDLRIFQFTIMEIGEWVHADQHTGRIIHIPNGKIFAEPQINYTRGWFEYIWDELPVLVTFESNWQRAKEILEEIGRKHGGHLGTLAEKHMRQASGRLLTFRPHSEPVVYTSVEDCGVLLTIRYLCEPRKRRNTSNAIWEDVLTGFAEYDDIDFAYPTQRFYDNAAEGKAPLRPDAPKDGGP